MGQWWTPGPLRRCEIGWPITYPTARRHTGKNRQVPEVLAGNRDVANPLSLDAEMFSTALERARQFYQLALIELASGFPAGSRIYGEGGRAD